MIATLSIAEAARDRRLSPHTLRYYERAGLLDAVPRDRGGRRRYTEELQDALTAIDHKISLYRTETA
jgi:DNA-binding transcriptional MerR regulator